MKFNKTIKVLISTNVLLNTASGFISPVFAIFIVDSIAGGSPKLAGTAVAVYWLVKSIVRLPVAYYLDKKAGEYDDYYAMMIGLVVYSLAHFLYVFASTPMHIYGIQLISGIGGAFAFTAWYGFFARHIDRNHESFEWSVDVSLVGFGVAFAGYISGIGAETFGYNPLFIASGIVSLSGIFMLLLIKRDVIPLKQKTNIEN